MRRILMSVLGLALIAGAATGDRYVGYYYPELTSEEDFERVIQATPPANKAVRVEFVTLLTHAQLAAPESPSFVVFAKGATSDQLIIIALDDEIFGTLYRARAVMAQMTSNSRGTEFFRQHGLHIAGTFYDMLQILEFDTLVISDGKTWSHRVNLKRN